MNKKLLDIGKKPTWFSVECRFEGTVKNTNEKNENCSSYAACGF